MRFSDKGFLVTGAGSGRGREVALHAAREGAHVAVGDVDLPMAERTVEDIAADGGRGAAFALNVTEPAAVDGFVEAAGAAVGGFDVLVNSAGIREIQSVLELSFEEWSRVMAVGSGPA